MGLPRKSFSRSMRPLMWVLIAGLAGCTTDATTAASPLDPAAFFQMIQTFLFDFARQFIAAFLF